MNLISRLVLLLFLILPFQRPLFYKCLKHLSSDIIPPGLTLPSYFADKLAVFPSEILLFILLCSALSLYRGKWLEFFFEGPSKYLTALFLVALFSIGSSHTANYLLMYTHFCGIALIMVLFHAVRIALDKDGIERLLKNLSYLLLAISLFECVVGLCQYFCQSNIGLKFIGETSGKFFKFGMQEGHRWIFDKIFHISGKENLLMRACGTFPHPNIFGGFHFCAMLATVYLYFTHSKKRLLLLAIAIQILVLMLIFSRAALICFFLMCTLWCALLWKERSNRPEIKKLAAVLAITMALCLCLFFSQLFARGGIVNYNKLVRGADAERLTYQHIAWELFKTRPLLGIGWNNFQIESHRFFPEGSILPSKVHNIYLLIAAEMGLLGISCFLLFLIAVLKNIWRIPSQEGLFLSSVFTGFLLIGACDFYFLHTPHGQILFFGFAAFLHVYGRQRYA